MTIIHSPAVTMYPKRIPKHLIFDPQPKRKSKAWFWWLMATISSLLLAVFSIDALAVEENPLQSGNLRLTTQSGQAVSALHLETNVTATISGLVVTTNYVQRFKNTSDHWAEGIYVFPLPTMAAIQEMEMIVGERRIIGEIRERNVAEKLYQQAKSAGKRAAITKQQRDNLFSQKVANIAPHQEIEVRLTFIDAVNYQSGVFEWRLPTTLTPRYIPGISALPNEPGAETHSVVNTNDFGWAMATDQVPDAPLITPKMAVANGELHNPLRLTVALQSGMELAAIEGMYHELEVKKQQDHYQIALRDGAVEMDRDVVLQWRPVLAAHPRAALFQQQLGNATYAMMMMIPPNTPSEQVLSKDIMFVIDVSGSMQGQSIVQAKASLALAIEQLGPQDRFNIIAFSDDYILFNPQLLEAGEAQKQIAQHWVSNLDADGGTEMYPALRAAYGQMIQAERLQQVVFITDGAIGNEEMLFDLITAPGHNARLFTVGIGSAPNTFFMTKAAQLGRGSYELIGSTDEVYSRMSRLFSKLSHVAATNIEIAWPSQAEPYPSQSGDLFHSEALMSFAKLTQPLNTLQVHGDTANENWQSTIQANAAVSADGVGALWARYKVADIEDQGRQGILNKAAVRDAVLDVALSHSLLTRFTAFIAIEEEPVRPITVPLLSEGIANVMPHGSTQQAVMFANTATTATLTFWLGTAGYCGLLLLRLTRRRDR